MDSIMLKPKQYRDDLTGEKLVAIQAVLPGGDIVASCSPRDMKDWLDKEGFKYVPGTQGIWARQ